MGVQLLLYRQLEMVGKIKLTSGESNVVITFGDRSNFGWRNVFGGFTK